MQLIPGAMGDTVWGVLSNAAIDWKIDDNGSAYVTSLDFPFWFDVLGGDEGFYFYTYCSVREGGGEAELLRSVNDCNLGLPMLQFSASKCGRRFQAHYSLYKPEGLHQRSFLFAAHRTAEIFMEVLGDEDNYVTGTDFEPVEPELSSRLWATIH